MGQLSASKPTQACVCPPASTVDSRHCHTRDDLISHPLPSAADSLSFLPRTISAYVCEKVANEVRRSRRRREQSDRRSTEGGRQSWMQDASPPSGALGTREKDPLLLRPSDSLPVRAVSSSRAARTTMMCAFKLAEDERGRCSARRGRWKKRGQVHRTEGEASEVGREIELRCGKEGRKNRCGKRASLPSLRVWHDGRIRSVSGVRSVCHLLQGQGRN